MGPFEDSVMMTGTTHASADTQKLFVNPLRRSDLWIRVHSGAGVYIEDDISKPGSPSGISASTLDIRSTNTAEPFLVELVVKNSKPIVHAGVAA